jgi:hypothetical protein
MKRNYVFKRTGDADVTAVYFDVLRKYAIDAKGAKGV